MTTYVVNSETTGVIAVCGDMFSAVYVLRGAVETHKDYCGKVVWLDKELKGTMNPMEAVSATVCNAKWERMAVIDITKHEIQRFTVKGK